MDGWIGAVVSRRKDADPGGKFAVLHDDQLFRAEGVDEEGESGDSEVGQGKLVEVLLFLEHHTFAGFPGLELSAGLAGAQVVLMAAGGGGGSAGRKAVLGAVPGGFSVVRRAWSCAGAGAGGAGAGRGRGGGAGWPG